MTTSNNPPAFPCEAQGDRNVPPEHDYIQTGIHSSKFPGMSLRDWFAGQALSGRMAIVADDDGVGLFDAFGNDLKTSEGMASSCYDIADAMLSARSVRSETDV